MGIHSLFFLCSWIETIRIVRMLFIEATVFFPRENIFLQIRSRCIHEAWSQSLHFFGLCFLTHRTFGIDSPRYLQGVIGQKELRLLSQRDLDSNPALATCEILSNYIELSQHYFPQLKISENNNTFFSECWVCWLAHNL